MDKNDKRINLSSFWFGKDEVKNYFFPSLVRETSEDEVRNEVKRLSILPDEDGMVIIRKSLGVIENPLVEAILNQDDDALEDLIDDENRDGSVYTNQGRLIIQVSELEGDAMDVDNCIDQYRMEGNNGWDWVHNDIENRYDDEEDYKNEIEDVFKEYYKNNALILKEELGVISYQQFKDDFFENYTTNEDLRDYYVDDVTDLSHRSYEAENDKEADEIEKYISFGDELNFSIVFLVQFLIKRNISGIGDQYDWTLRDMTDSYISNYRLTTEISEPIYNYETITPKYGDSNYITRETDKYFDKLLSNPEINSRCVELRKQLNNLIEKYFNGGYGSNRYENDHVKVIIRSTNIDCEKESIKIDFVNKDNGQSFYGRYIKVENLPRYLTNYELDLKESKLKLMSIIK
jgi:hypothetical protein